MELQCIVTDFDCLMKIETITSNTIEIWLIHYNALLHKLIFKFKLKFYWLNFITSKSLINIFLSEKFYQKAVFYHHDEHKKWRHWHFLIQQNFLTSIFHSHEHLKFNSKGKN